MMNMVRCLLSEKSIPKTFWAKAVPHIINDKCNSKGKLRMELNHLAFGSITHVHIPYARRTKLEGKSFISEESKGYRLYDLVSKKIVISCDVEFEDKWK
ncbi:hypothetical protein CR513_30801, partial [Mucuna pruriens]